MQEEVEQRTVTLIVNTAKLTERELQKAISKMLIQMRAEHQHRSPKEKHGKMTVKQLAAQNRGMQSYNLDDGKLKDFTRIARKYGIDFAPYKVKGEERFIIFFKGADKDVMDAAFNEYSRKYIKISKDKAPEKEILEKPSVLAKLQKIKEFLASISPAKEKRRERER